MADEKNNELEVTEALKSPAAESTTAPAAHKNSEGGLPWEETKKVSWWRKYMVLIIIGVFFFLAAIVIGVSGFNKLTGEKKPVAQTAAATTETSVTPATPTATAPATEAPATPAAPAATAVPPCEADPNSAECAAYISRVRAKNLMSASVGELVDAFMYALRSWFGGNLPVASSRPGSGGHTNTVTAPATPPETCVLDYNPCADAYPAGYHGIWSDRISKNICVPADRQGSPVHTNGSCDSLWGNRSCPNLSGSNVNHCWRNRRCMEWCGSCNARQQSNRVNNEGPPQQSVANNIGVIPPADEPETPAPAAQEDNTGGVQDPYVFAWNGVNVTEVKACELVNGSCALQPVTFTGSQATIPVEYGSSVRIYLGNENGSAFGSSGVVTAAGTSAFRFDIAFKGSTSPAWVPLTPACLRDDASGVKVCDVIY